MTTKFLRPMQNIEACNACTSLKLRDNVCPECLKKFKVEKKLLSMFAARGVRIEDALKIISKWSQSMVESTEMVKRYNVLEINKPFKKMTIRVMESSKSKPNFSMLE